MGFLKGIVGKAVGEGIGKGITDAVSASAEAFVKPAAEKWAEETAKVLNSATEAAEQFQAETDAAPASDAAPVEGAVANVASAAIFNTALKNYPAWTYTAIEDVTTEEEDEYISILLTAKLDDDLVQKYQSALQGSGFGGDWQLMQKTIDGKKHYVDFSFVMDGQLRYLIYK